jgi:N-acetyl-anhydromuramyl-L-alanine amidase AmpD
MTDILWVGYPRAYTKGRKRKVQVVVLHYTAGSEGPTSAEGGAAYDKVRTDGTSTHFFTDSAGPALQEVPDGDRAHTARFHGNEIGVNIEICGTVQTRAQWLDPVSMATLRTTAGLVAILLVRHNLAFRRLTTAELRRAYYSEPSLTGIVDHNACTMAFPEDGGTHTDLGAAFPWDVFLDMVRAELTGKPVSGKDDTVKLFLFKGRYWESRGDGADKCRREVADGEGVTARDKVMRIKIGYPGCQVPSADGNGFPFPDLSVASSASPEVWSEAQVTYVFGPVVTTWPSDLDGGSSDGELSDSEVERIAASVVAGIGRGFTQEVALSITGSGRAVTTAAPR